MKLYFHRRWMVTFVGLGVVFSLLQTQGSGSARAEGAEWCVNATGTGCSSTCGGCFSKIQQAVDSASPGDEIRISGGEHTAPGGAGVLAFIEKKLTLTGGYSTDLSAFDPVAFETILDAGETGSVIKVSEADRVTLRHLTLTRGMGAGNCGPYGCGGGLWIHNTNVQIENCKIIGNVATDFGGGLGGGIYAFQDGDQRLGVFSSDIHENTASANADNPAQYGYGGAIFAQGGMIHIEENDVWGNLGTEKYSGSGGIHLFAVLQGNIQTNHIHDNQSTKGAYWVNAPGVIAENSTMVNLKGNRMEHNQGGVLEDASASYGGAVMVYNSEAVIEGNFFLNNSAGSPQGYGGGVCVLSPLPTVMVNNVFAGNTVGPSGQGGAVAVIRYGSSQSQAELLFNTIINSTGAGVAASEQALIILKNNILAGNDYGIKKYSEYDIDLAGEHNLFWNNPGDFTGTDWIEADPRLTPAFMPSAGSPAVDAGLELPGWNFDIQGNPRPRGRQVDLGAFEMLRVWMPRVQRAP